MLAELRGRSSGLCRGEDPPAPAQRCRIDLLKARPVTAHDGALAPCKRAGEEKIKGLSALGEDLDR